MFRNILGGWGIPDAAQLGGHSRLAYTTIVLCAIVVVAGLVSMYLVFDRAESPHIGRRQGWYLLALFIAIMAGGITSGMLLCTDGARYLGAVTPHNEIVQGQFHTLLVHTCIRNSVVIFIAAFVWMGWDRIRRPKVHCRQAPAGRLLPPPIPWGLAAVLVWAVTQIRV